MRHHLHRATVPRRADSDVAPPSPPAEPGTAYGFMSNISFSLLLRISLWPVPGVQPLKSNPQTLLAPVGHGAGYSPPGSKINQSEKNSRGRADGGSGGVGAFRHRRDRQRGMRCLLVTAAPSTPPRRWRERSKGFKQINMDI